MVTKLAVAFFPKSTKEMSEDDTPHDEYHLSNIMARFCQ
jgi:hypothetical protein